MERPLREGERHNNLLAKPVGFVGREGQLLEIHERLSRGEVVSLNGMGGVGKTYLALEYSYRHEKDYDHICWVDAEGNDITSAMAWLASDPLALPLSPDAKTADIHRRVIAELEGNGRHLLILDNVDHPKAWRAAIPTAGSVRVLITTRRSRLPGAETVAIEVLPRADALRLLRGPEPLGEQDETDANALCEELGDLALAIAVAGALLKSPFSSPGALLHELREQGPMEWSEAQSEEVDELPKHPSLISLFQTSIDQLDESKPVDALALAVFKVAGWLAPVELELALLAQVSGALMGREVDEAQTIAALRRLEKIGLLRVGESGGVSLHRLLREFSRVLGEEPAREAVLDVLQAKVSQTASETLALLGLLWLRPHLEEVVEQLKSSDDPERSWLPLRLAQHCRNRGEYESALSACELALAVVSDERWRSYLLNEAGQALHRQGKYAEALEVYSRSLAITEKTLGEEHPETAITLHAIGQALHRQGKYAEALDYYSRSLAITEKTLGEEHPDTAITLNAIGQALASQGKYAEALDYYSRSLAIKEKTLGEEHPSTASTLHAIGQALDAQGKYAEALDYYSRDLAITEKTLGEEHPETAITLNAIGQALHRQGKYAEALDSLRRSLAIKEKTLGVEHPETAITLATIAQSKAKLDERAEARRLFERALYVLDKMLGASHPTTRAVRAEMERLTP
ncbi:MAG: tetratricopeptide repeat protein [Polyangiaceae bacterium]|nr:tetratricopeptide repeat protein [Polyangiaceae bacterium]